MGIINKLAKSKRIKAKQKQESEMMLLTRQNPHQIDAATKNILAEADRTTRKASTSSGRAAKALIAAQQENDNVHIVVDTFTEAQEAFDTAMEERLEIEVQIEQHEQELAEAEARQAAEIERLRQAVLEKREALKNAYRRVQHYNTKLHQGNWK